MLEKRKIKEKEAEDGPFEKTLLFLSHYHCRFDLDLPFNFPLQVTIVPALILSLCALNCCKWSHNNKSFERCSPLCNKPVSWFYLAAATYISASNAQRDFSTDNGGVIRLLLILLLDLPRKLILHASSFELSKIFLVI